jgi:hypothetical protein
MPMPVSATRNIICSVALSLYLQSNRPVLGELEEALESRLKSVCRTFVWSARMVPRSVGEFASNLFAFLATSGCTVLSPPTWAPAGNPLSGTGNTIQLIFHQPHNRHFILSHQSPAVTPSYNPAWSLEHL